MIVKAVLYTTSAPPHLFIPKEDYSIHDAIVSITKSETYCIAPKNGNMVGTNLLNFTTTLLLQWPWPRWVRQFVRWPYANATGFDFWQ